MRTCKTCQHISPTRFNNDTEGICKRYPTPKGKPFKVLLGDYCGEWQQVVAQVKEESKTAPKTKRKRRTKAEIEAAKNLDKWTEGQEKK